MTQDKAALADKIEQHLRADITGGYILSEDEQRMIVAALRSDDKTKRATIEEATRKDFELAESTDTAERFYAWGRLESAGLAKVFMVRGRFAKMHLTERGEQMKLRLAQPASEEK